MERYKSKWFAVCVLGISAYLLSSKLSVNNTVDVESLRLLSNTFVEEKLQNHSHEFDVAQITEIKKKKERVKNKTNTKKKKKKVTEGVFVAIGYAIANSVIVECNESLVVIDTTESIASASRIREDLLTSFPRLQQKKVKYVVYTHYHPDHTFGTKGWVDDERNPPVVIAHPQTTKELERILSLTSTITQVRAQRQFGTILKKLKDSIEPHAFSHLDAHGGDRSSHYGHECGSDHTFDYAAAGAAQDQDEQLRLQQVFQNDSSIFVNSGIGPFLVFEGPFDRSMFYPTLILNQTIEILDLDGTLQFIFYRNIEYMYTYVVVVIVCNFGEGVTFEFHHAPGETIDQIFIYLPEKRVLLPADNVYRAFPNIYAIRGSPTRPAREWVKSIDSMRALSPFPRYLVPHHTQPVYGEEAIYDVLTSYRDGIAFVHDQTIRFVNLGYVPDDIVVLVRQSMPERLLSHPFLQEFYGTIDWSVRAIFQAYLGWFSGDPVDLYPLSKQQQGTYTFVSQRRIRGCFFVFVFFFLSVNHCYLVFSIRLTKMVKSPNVILETAQDSLLNHEKRDDCQWALQLSDALLFLSKPANEMSKEDLILAMTETEVSKALDIKIKALQCLASYMTSANGRNYYLTSAYELLHQKHADSEYVSERDREWVSHVVPLEQLFQMLPVRFKANEVKMFNSSMCFHFTDMREFYMLTIRDGVVEVCLNFVCLCEQKKKKKFM
ncbi:hypothetical protein RFI_17751 [Reticulomyxa filosa]|uniref:Metallo-beta-lactamase domain-containing protein n=1 Tax=Reticulomyxa filosa TaxID=46433 RepID=X6N2E0_RETFI|nr:hypothetical protein RFI_17751 [Reticulomyxa filosa]|eukprot:ETO19477.1 hypothetical protein RFI_17751 [Reticulomyxa filosa]